MITAFASCAHGTQQPSVTYAVFDYLDIPSLAKHHKPVLSELRRSLKRPVILRSSRGEADFKESVRQEKPLVVYAPQHIMHGILSGHYQELARPSTTEFRLVGRHTAALVDTKITSLHNVGMASVWLSVHGDYIDIFSPEQQIRGYESDNTCLFALSMKHLEACLVLSETAQLYFGTRDMNFRTIATAHSSFGPLFFLRTQVLSHEEASALRNQLATLLNSRPGWSSRDWQVLQDEPNAAGRGMGDGH